MNFSWLINDRVAGHAEPHSLDDLVWLFDQGIRTAARMSTNPRVSLADVTKAGLEDQHEPVPDWTAPTQVQLDRMVEFIKESVAQKKPVGVSCTAGQGRTGTVLACYLVSTGFAADAAILEVRRKRPGSIETEDQEAAVKLYASRVGKERKALYE